jgi:hypothetical protein
MPGRGRRRASSRSSGAGTEAGLRCVWLGGTERVFTAGRNGVLSVHRRLDASLLKTGFQEGQEVSDQDPWVLFYMQRRVIGVLARSIFFTLIVVHPLIGNATQRISAHSCRRGRSVVDVTGRMPPRRAAHEPLRHYSALPPPSLDSRRAQRTGCPLRSAVDFAFMPPVERKLRLPRRWLDS